MAQVTYTANTQVPPNLGEAEKAILQLWYYNNPVDLKPSEYNVKIPIPKPGGPQYPYPIDKSIFPLVEWNIPLLHMGTFRRIAIWIKPEPADDDLLYAAYATLALMYSKPDYRITSAQMIVIKATDKQIKMAVDYGIGLSVVPVVQSVVRS